MKTLENHTLLYDVDCPLCVAYTSGFMKTKMLDEQGRKPFNQLSVEEQQYVDVHRATNEIALVDTENKRVLYGIDSMLKVIGNSFPTVEKLGKLPPIYYALQKLYALISYNRKVIIPTKLKPKKALDCIPDFNMKYRLLYVFLTLCFASTIVIQFYKFMPMLPQMDGVTMIALMVGQFAFQVLFLLKRDTKTIVHYIGNLSTVLLIGALLLVPVIGVLQVFPLPDLAIFGVFGGVIFSMFFEHHRRVQLLELPNYLPYTWILYRIIILLLILNI